MVFSLGKHIYIQDKFNLNNMKSLLMTFILSIITILAPIKAFIVITSLFVLADTSFAIYATIKVEGIRAYRSNKLFNIVIKSFFYMASIVLAFLIDKYIIEGQLLGIKLLLTKALTLLWCYIEVKSMDETSVKLGYRSLWVIIKELINKCKSLKEDLGDITKL